MWSAVFLSLEPTSQCPIALAIRRTPPEFTGHSFLILGLYRELWFWINEVLFESANSDWSDKVAKYCKHAVQVASDCVKILWTRRVSTGFAKGLCGFISTFISNLKCLRRICSKSTLLITLVMLVWDTINVNPIRSDFIYSLVQSRRQTRSTRERSNLNTFPRLFRSICQITDSPRALWWCVYQTTSRETRAIFWPICVPQDIEQIW